MKKEKVGRGGVRMKWMWVLILIWLGLMMCGGALRPEGLACWTLKFGTNGMEMRQVRCLKVGAEVGGRPTADSPGPTADSPEPTAISTAEPTADGQQPTATWAAYPTIEATATQTVNPYPWW